MAKTPYVDENGIRRGTWSKEEDEKLKAFVNNYGHLNWSQLPKLAGLSRCGKSCRLRWMNYLRPNVKRGNFSKEEEDIIVKLHESLGNKWSLIASQLPGRTDSEVKNQWHSFLKKRSTMETLERSKDPKPKSKRRGHYQKSKSSRLEIEGSTLSKGDFFIHGILESSDLSNSNLSFNESSISNVTEIEPIDPIMSMFTDGDGVFSRENLDVDLWMQPFLASNSENISSDIDWVYLINHELSPIPEEEFNIFYGSYRIYKNKPS